LHEGAGAAVTVASNGRIAVDTLLTGSTPPVFDAVLMDLQMPEMDGYEATARIRADARFAGLPVIAMTAHATNEERQRCLDAGMNDHVGKPIDPEVLVETLARFLRSGAPDSAGLPRVAGLDTSAALRRVGGNRGLYLKLLRQFVAEQGQALDAIGAALEAGDRALAERLAHTLKGVAGNIGATAVQPAAGDLERSIRDGVSATALVSARAAVSEALDPLIAALGAELSSTSVVTGPDPVVPVASGRETTIESRATLERLATLLSELDPEAAGFLAANQGALRPVIGEARWGEFESLVSGYAFTDAQAMLEQAIKNVPGDPLT